MNHVFAVARLFLILGACALCIWGLYHVEAYLFGSSNVTDQHEFND